MTTKTTKTTAPSSNSDILSLPLHMRSSFLSELHKTDPPVQNFILTSSGIVEPIPSPEGWEQFKGNFIKI
jgi:hypothetical protein